MIFSNHFALSRNLSTIKTIVYFFPSHILFYTKGVARSYSSDQYVKYYGILGIPVSSDQETVREAFLKLVKKYHPDSGSSETDTEKFQEIENAYRKLQEKFAAERWKVDEEMGEYGLYYQEKTDQEFNIKHTAPQHRQYLSYGGYGTGTPRQREKQYQKRRAQEAIENVYNHRISKVPCGEEQTLVVKDKKEAKKIKTRSEMERLVEDLIQESMARGDFDNLPGSGKPLKTQNFNPYVDFVTQKMNEMLIDNGFTPEWITLQKEIPKEINDIRDYLAQKRMHIGPESLNSQETLFWKEELTNLSQRVHNLNKKINNYNLQVPLLNKQMILFQLEKEAANILKCGKTKMDVSVLPISKNQNIPIECKGEDVSLFGFFERLLFKKE